jgi:hypothetical protein
MKSNSLHPIFLLLYLLSVPPRAEAQQHTYYVHDGKNLQVMYDRPADANYIQWQIWFYQERVHIPHYTAGLPYSRWGLIEGRSVENVINKLETFQSFERAYLNFFGPGAWGRYTFLNPLGPIAITSEAVKEKPSEELYLEELYLSDLNSRIERLIATIQPSLENNENDGLGSPVKDYFDQIRDSLEQVAKLYSQLAHVHPQAHFIDDRIVRTRTAVAQAENNVPKITAVLPSVKLPTSNAWMSHTEWAGSDGTIQVTVTETGSWALVQQTWTGGDGRMTGTVVLTTIPYEDVANVELEPPTRSGDNTWTVRIHSAGSLFPETWSSPERKTARGVFRAVKYRTTTNFVYLVFTNAAEAQDAYAYFRYHQELGRFRACPPVSPAVPCH